MTNTLIPTSALTEFGDEPRIQDLVLGERLGFDRPRKIRDIIARNRVELEVYGELPQKSGIRAVSPHSGAKGASAVNGRTGSAYYLNEGQALVICALSRTEKAAQIRKLIIDVFMAWRRGKTVDVKEHYRRPPAPAVTDGRFDMKQSGPGKLVKVDALVPFDLACEYAMMFSNYRRVTF